MKLFRLIASLLGLAVVGTAQGANPVVIMETSLGTIKIELFEDKSPVTVKNFLTYVDDKHYDGTIFHRVKDTFMIQGGGFDADGKEKKSREPIKNEASNGLSNKKGTLAMARTMDPDSATAQFFVNTVDNNFLDKNDGSAGYCVFGKVIEGMDIVDKIKSVKTVKGRLSDWQPVETVTIKSVRRAK
jgi:cyclophilin family peptidyl-prolyl cis-trans isomerase